MEGELIYVSIISGLFGLLGLFFLNWNWFKKENFKITKASMLAENKLRLKKLERELLGTPPAESVVDNQGFNIGSLASLLKNLSPDQIANLTDTFLGGRAEEGEGGDVTDMIGSFVKDNPELVKGFLDGLSKKGGAKDGGFSQV